MSDYHAKGLAKNVLEKVTAPMDPCPDIKASYALFRTLREESYKQPPRDRKPLYMDIARTLPSFTHPYMEKRKQGSYGSSFTGNNSSYAGSTNPYARQLLTKYVSF